MTEDLKAAVERLRDAGKNPRRVDVDAADICLVLDALRKAQAVVIAKEVESAIRGEAGRELQAKVREQGVEIERLKKRTSNLLACKNCEERAEKAEAELAAERERAESLRRLHDDHCSMGCGLTSGITEALRPAAPEAKESDCTCGEQWPCPLHGGPPAAPDPTPSEKCPYCGLTTCRYGADPTSTCHAKGDSCRCSEQPDLPLGHEFVAGHPHPAYQSYCALRGIFGLCGQTESAHRGKP